MVGSEINMNEDKARQYADDCKKSGNLDYPLAGGIRVPKCKICTNYIPRDKNWNPPQCKTLGTIIPDEYRAARRYDCPHFIHDKKSIHNQFFDENLNPLLK